MKSLKSFGSQMLMLVVLASCASAQVYENEDGTYNSVLADGDKETALSKTLTGARKYCEKQGKTVVVISHQAPYEGNMSEGANSAVKSASQVASIMGVTNANTIGYSATRDNKYHGTLKFRCK